MPPLRNTMMKKLHSSLCNRWFLNSVDLKFSPALLLKTGFVLDSLISDIDYFHHSHRAAASPVLLAFYSVPESILAQLLDTVVVYTYDTQSKAVDFSRINTEDVLCLFWGFFVCLFVWGFLHLSLACCPHLSLFYFPNYLFYSIPL